MPAAQLQIGTGNEGQVEAWDGDEGDLWSRYPEFFDTAIRVHHERLMKASAIEKSERVLDVGCGNGQTTCDSAEAASSGSALGVDLSSKMIDNARAVAARRGIANASFLQADAQVNAFEPEAFDIALSRTGTMFFSDQLAAFANIARALRHGGRLAMLSWSGPEGNEWLTSFMQAMTLGRPGPTPPPDGPGPFAHADRGRVTQILTSAGFADVSLELSQAPMYFGRTAEDGFEVMSKQLGWLARPLPEEDRRQAFENLRASLRAHETADGVAYRSSAWLIAARRI